jgi:serine protease Do
MKFRLFHHQPKLVRSSFLILTACFSSLELQVQAVETTRTTPIVQAIQRAEPAVVNIQGNKTVTNTSSSGSSAKQEVNGMGTGVIIDRRGYIITNYHVVDEVNRIEVTLADGTTAIAKMLNYDPETDLALIKIQTNRDLPVIAMGRSDDLMRGETVIAIGNPFGYQNTVTVGIISALHRDIPVNGTQQYNDLIQTNADINPGNSGGPLLNIDGDVIGINVAVRVGAQGIGFAIPIDTALDVMSELVAAHRESGALGISFAKNSAESAGQVIVRDASSVRSSQGRDIQAGDQIESVDGQSISSRLELEFAMLDRRDGQQIELGLKRNGKFVSQSVTLSGGKGVSDSDTSRVAWEQLGMRLSVVAASSLSGLGESYKGGLRINEVRPGSPADRARLAAGDIIVGVMEWQTPKMESLAWILNSASFKQTESAKYYLIRKRSKMTVAISTEPSALSAISRSNAKDVR